MSYIVDRRRLLCLMAPRLGQSNVDELLEGSTTFPFMQFNWL